MKIGLLTYFWENNTGQYWQAVATLNALRARFPEARVELVNVRHWGRPDNRPVSRQALLKPWLLPASYRHLKGFRHGRKQHFSYSPQECVTHDYAEAMRFINAQKYDLLVVGADVVLKPLPETLVARRVPLYWLAPEIEAPRALLASSGDITRADQLPADTAERMARSLAGFGYIGVRDAMTADLCQALGTATVPVQRTPDPTFTLTTDPAWARDAERAFPPRNPARKRALIRLAPHPGVNTLVQELKKMGFEVLSSGKPVPGTTRAPALGPTAWAGMSTCVDLLVTMSFHESIFALKHGRPVIAVDVQPNRYDKDTHASKTQCLMVDMGLHDTHHLNIQAAGGLRELFRQKAEAALAHEYGPAQNHLQDMRQQYAQALDALAELSTPYVHA